MGVVVENSTSKKELTNRVTMIEYFGKEVVSADFSDLKGDDVLNLMECLVDTTLKYKGKRVLHLMNATRMKMNNQVKEYCRDAFDLYQLHGIKVDTAIVGMTGIQKIIAKGIGPDFYYANDMQFALDWLVTQEFTS